MVCSHIPYWMFIIQYGDESYMIIMTSRKNIWWVFMPSLNCVLLKSWCPISVTWWTLDQFYISVILIKVTVMQVALFRESWYPENDVCSLAYLCACVRACRAWCVCSGYSFEVLTKYLHSPNRGSLAPNRMCVLLFPSINEVTDTVWRDQCELAACETYLSCNRDWNTDVLITVLCVAINTFEVHAPCIVLPWGGSGVM